MTDMELIELAERAQAWRVRPITCGADMGEALVEVTTVMAQVPALVAELRETRRRLAELAGPKVEW